MGNEKSLAHTRWNCKYHIVFCAKIRRQVFYREKRRAIGSILRKLCEWKVYGFWKLNAVQIISICLWRSRQNERIRLYGYLKGKSSLMLYEQFGDLKFKYRNREFWCRGYYVDTVGKNTAKNTGLHKAPA
ncbi:transposase [Escherichia coli]|uniref:Transposase n=1 Tax=Escherichia coli TaxID=562 RepID=A0A377D6F7_ECOLX|nr:transposase [Escherichia coli]